MIANIIDKRTHRYIVNCDAVFEASWHDNRLRKDLPSTQFPRDDAIDFDEMTDTTIAEAMKHAAQLNGNITVFLYDPNTAMRESESLAG